MAVAIAAHATLPPEPPKGISVLNNGGRALRTPILANCSVDMISLVYNWDLLEQNEGTYDFSGFSADLTTINATVPGKPVLLRINTMGGCAPAGKIPSWVFTAMREPDCTTYTPGVAYSFFDTGASITRWIPVFWDPTYLAKKRR